MDPDVVAQLCSGAQPGGSLSESDLDDDPARSMVAIAHNILWRKNQIERLVFDGLSMTH